jgi:hypothetical protein
VSPVRSSLRLLALPARSSGWCSVPEGADHGLAFLCLAFLYGIADDRWGVPGNQLPDSWFRGRSGLHGYDFPAPRPLRQYGRPISRQPRADLWLRRRLVEGTNLFQAAPRPARPDKSLVGWCGFVDTRLAFGFAVVLDELHAKNLTWITV